MPDNLARVLRHLRLRVLREYFGSVLVATPSGTRVVNDILRLDGAGLLILAGPRALDWTDCDGLTIVRQALIVASMTLVTV